MSKCKKLYEIINKVTGETETALLEGLENQFTHQIDWFIIITTSCGNKVFTQRKKIPRELGEKLWEMVNKNEL